MTRQPQTNVRRISLLFVALGLLAAMAACSGSSDNRPSVASEALSLDRNRDFPGSASVPDGDEAQVVDPQLQNSTGESADASTPSGNNRAAPTERAVIRTGNVSIEHEDVGQSRVDVREIVDRHRGEIGSQETSTDSDGQIDRLRLEIRVPSKAFDDTMAEISELGTLRSSDASADDVTTEVIDTESRVKSQERSIARIQRLLAGAESLEQIISIESQLASRQADLESLKSQLAYLQDQSSMSTITVHVSKADHEVVEEDDKERTGFLAGLSDGWSGMKTVGIGIATAIGLVLPYVVVLLILALPLRLLIRRRPRPAEMTSSAR